MSTLAVFSLMKYYEEIRELPDFTHRCTSKWTGIISNEKKIYMKLSNLKINKSAEPDQIHPRMLKEMS